MKNKTLQNELKDILGDRFSESKSVRKNYAGGEDIFEPIISEAVVFPENNQEISSIAKICNKHKTSIIPFGTGTSLEGNVLGNIDGITMSLEKMNKVISINEDDFDCRVQAFVTRKQLNEELKSKGVFFPIDPGADASLGGMTATSASGTMAVKYGTMKTVVLGLTVILANGDIIRTGTRSKKTAAGYNLTASAKRGNKRIIAVVFGSGSVKLRTKRMTELLDIGFAKAKNVKRDVRLSSLNLKRLKRT